MSTDEVLATELNNKLMMVESPSSVDSMPQSQCTTDAADSEDEFQDAVEPPSSTSVAYDGAAPPLSGVYEDALEATEQQIAAALQSTTSDGTARQPTIQEDDGQEKTEVARVEAAVVAVIDEIVESVMAEMYGDEEVKPVEEDADTQSEEEPEKDVDDELVQLAQPKKFVDESADVPVYTRNEAARGEAPVEDAVADRSSPAVSKEDTLEKVVVQDNGVGIEDSLQLAANYEEERDMAAVAKTKESITDKKTHVTTVLNEDNKATSAPDATDVLKAPEAEQVATVDDGAVAVAGATIDNPEVKILYNEDTPAVHSTSQEAVVDVVSEHSSPTMTKTLEGDEYAVEAHATESSVDDEAPDDDDNDEEVVAIEDDNQEELVEEEVNDEDSMTPTDEQVIAPTSSASVTGAADEDSVDGTEQELSQPEENVDPVHAQGANAKEIIFQAAKVEEDQHAVTPEHNPAEEETEVSPVLEETPDSSYRKSSDHHELSLAAVSLLPRLAPSSETTTTTTLEPFVLSSDSNEMLEVHFPPQRFTYEVFGFSIERRVVFYHVHRSDRRTGIREPAILKRYTDFRELQLQLLDSCLRAAADMPRIPRPHLGTVLRGYKSKKTIEIRERAFRALLRYIAQYPALHGSAIFEQFITTSRVTTGAGWM
ncbi:hypothetical protein PF008_g17905 [Phytophthora fragariae]|uniref:PX domain-containing protein n=2 Tax=Phytophthora fragariae TaxID=53985 RepID=A0A6G0R877_9STRA|nr:hypothetical protein PF008_g17905 [Phytophthora fragariae]